MVELRVWRERDVELGGEGRNRVVVECAGEAHVTVQVTLTELSFEFGAERPVTDDHHPHRPAAGHKRAEDLREQIHAMPWAQTADEAEQDVTLARAETGAHCVITRTRREQFRVDRVRQHVNPIRRGPESDRVFAHRRRNREDGVSGPNCVLLAQGRQLCQMQPPVRSGLKAERRVDLQEQRDGQSSRDLGSGGPHQGEPFVDEVGTVQFKLGQERLHERLVVEDAADLVRDGRLGAEHLVGRAQPGRRRLDRVVNRTVPDRRVDRRGPVRFVAGQDGRDQRHLMTSATKRRDEGTHVHRCALGGEDGDARVCAEVEDLHGVCI